MERHRTESSPTAVIRVLKDHKDLLEASELVRRFSWGEDYPVAPLSEIEHADYRVGAYANEKLIGFASVGREFSPDRKDNDALWLAHAVVTPEFREQGVFQKLYDEQMSFALAGDAPVYSCTDNPVVESFFLSRGWQKVRDTKDEAGDPCRVYTYLRPQAVGGPR